MNIDSKDTMLLTTRNKVLECINLCKEKHGGPLTSIKELDKVLKQFKNDNKSIDRILNLELRLRRLTFTKVKLSCPLFKQQNISLEEKITNLKSFIATQLDMKTLANMSDLEIAIQEGEEDQPVSPQTTSSSNKTATAYHVGDYVVGLFDDGFYPGEIIKVEKEYIMTDFLKPVSLKQNYQDTSFWKKTYTM